MEVAPILNKSLAIFDAEDLQRYQATLTVLGRQVEWLRQTQTALEEGRIVVQALENERARLWKHLCETYGLDSDAVYSIDGAGRVFERTA